MKKAIITLILTFNLAAFSGDAGLSGKSLDSLYNVWNNLNTSDSVRVKAYESYIRQGYLRSQPDSAIILIEDLERFAKEKHYPRAQAVAEYLEAVSFYLRGDYSIALIHCKQSALTADAISAVDMTAMNLNLLGLIFEKQGFLSKALEFHQRSLKLSEELEDKRGIAFSLNNIGEILNNQGNSSGALEYFERSLALIQELNSKQWIGGAMANIGQCYANQGDFEKAFEYYKTSLEYYEAINDKVGLIQTLYAIGEAYYETEDTSQALTYLKHSLEISEEMDYKRGAVLSKNAVGNIYFEQGDYINSLEYCQQSLELAEKINAFELQRDACNCVYQNYYITDKKELALNYLQKLYVLDDSLNVKETAKALQKMNFQKRIIADSLAQVEKDRLMEQAHQEEVRTNEKQRNILITVSMLVLLIAGGIYSRLRYVRKSKAIIENEKDRSEKLLLNILPAEIAQELKEKGKADARDFEMVSILFTDFKGFTEQSEKLSAAELVNEINHCFEAFDGIMEKYGIEKIKTIGDAYMAAGGLPVPTDDSVKNTVLAALEMQAFIANRKAEHDAKGEPAFEMRVGIHTGPVVAGIVGVKKFQYDIWGDTVNTASRMESSGEVGKVNISQATYELLKSDPQFVFESRGKIEAKGKGEMEMYFVSLNNRN